VERTFSVCVYVLSSRALFGTDDNSVSTDLCTM
jgi:hypothetical protein